MVVLLTHYCIYVNIDGHFGSFKFYINHPHACEIMILHTSNPF